MLYRVVDVVNLKVCVGVNLLPKVVDVVNLKVCFGVTQGGFLTWLT